MREDIGDGVWVDHLDEVGVRLDAVVETVEVYEVHWLASVVL